MSVRKIQNDTIKATKLVLQKPAYVVICLAVACIVLLLSVMIPNSDFLRFTFVTDIFTGAEKVSIISKQLGGFFTFFTLRDQIMLVIVALLAGLNISFLAFYLRRRIVNQRGAGLGIVGIIVSLFGVGCAACGSVILTAIIGLGASGQVIGFLPFHGFEFNLIALAIIIGSNMYLASKIVNPNVCKI